MYNRYTASAILFMAVVIASYVIQFYFYLGYELSEKPSDWVTFSNYVGGLITPLLSFVSLVLLIHSLNLQNDANKRLRSEIELNHKNEKLRAFETYFFGLIEAQKISFSNFKLNFASPQGNNLLLGVGAIRELEDQIEILRGNNTSISDIEVALENIDKDEHIYNTVRIFYNIIKMTTEKLADSEGFDEKSRKYQFQTLISFTELSQLRLVMISMQFINCPPSIYLKSNKEFMDVLKELGGGDNLY